MLQLCISGRIITRQNVNVILVDKNEEANLLPAKIWPEETKHQRHYAIYVDSWVF